MIQVEIPGSYITANDLNNIIARAKTSPKENKREVFKIVALKRLEEVEISFIGYLMLLLEKYPHLHFELNFEHNFKKTDHEFFRKLTQYGTYAYLMLKRDPFLLKLGDGTSHFRLSEYSTFPENWLVHSDSFMLLFLISRRRSFVHQCFFEKSFAQLTEKTPVDKHNSYIGWSEDDEKLFQLYNHAILDSSETKDPDGCLINLGRIAFYKSLRNAAFLVKFLRAGDDRAISLNAEFLKTQRLFQEMMHCPLIYTLVFATISSKQKLEAADADGRLETLWAFTKEFVSGLRELVKNIDDHVSNNCGVVAAQVFREKSDQGIERNSFARLYWQRDPFSQASQGVLFTSVFDLGDTGIIPTLNSDTRKRLESLEKSGDKTAELFRKDLDLLSSMDFKVNSLFDIKNPSRLYQQCKRHLAHCGLLRLASLIDNNSGGLNVSTSSLFGRQSFSMPHLPVNPAEDIFHGTSISLILPIRKKATFVSPLQHYLPSDSTEKDIQGIEDLFSLQRKPLEKGLDVGGTVAKTLIEYAPVGQKIGGEEDEVRLWAEIDSRITESGIYKDISRRHVLCLDLENITMDSSELLRLAGNLEFSYPDLPVILKGIAMEKFGEFIDINKTISGLSKSLDFWNSSNPLIVLSYLHDEDLGRFYFTDVLWGNSFEDNLAINENVSRAHFNLTANLYGQEMKLGKQNGKNGVGKIDSPFFYSNGSLLPMDLLFKDENQLTYFEQNAFVLLQNNFK